MNSQYSRIYRVEAKTRRALDAVAIFLIAGSLALTAFQVRGVLKPALLLQSIVIDLACLCVALATFWRGHQKVILTEDAIEVAGWLVRRSVKLDEILGYRMGQLPKRVGGASYYKIQPRSSGKPLALPPYLHTDEFFREWIRSLPKLKP